MNNGIIFRKNFFNESLFIDDYYIDQISSLFYTYQNVDDFLMDEKFEKQICSYTQLYQDYLRKMDYSKRFSIVQNTKTVSFVENLRTIYRVKGEELTKDEIFEILDKNSFLFEQDLNYIVPNYEHLKDTAYLSSDLLDYIYCDGHSSMEDRIISFIRNKEKIPNRYRNLAVYPEEDILFEIDQNLKFLVSSYAIRSFRDLNPKVLKCFDLNLFENRVKYDNEIANGVTSRFINFSLFEKYFQGMKMDIIDLLDKISPNLVDDLSNLYDLEPYCKFIQSFDTIQKWNRYSNPMERAVDFKDEFITRIIFGSVFQTGVDYQKEHPNVTFREFLKLVANNKVPLRITEQTLKLMTGDTIREVCNNNPEVLRTVDRFISSNKGNLKGTVYRSYYFASKLFGETNDYYKINEDNNDHNSINNHFAFEFMKDPYFNLGDIINRERIVDEVYASIREYPKLSNKEKDITLKNLFKTIHYYMVQHEEYMIQNDNQSRDEKQDVRILAKKIFSSKSNKYNMMDRLLYCTYNANRLAHSMSDILRKVPYRDKFVFRKDSSSFVENLMSNYNSLHQYGFSVDYLNEQLNLFSQNSDRSLFDQANNDSNEFLEYVRNFVPLEEHSVYPLDESNVSSVMENLQSLKKLNQTTDYNESNCLLREQFSIFAKEENMFFDLKRFFAEEAIRITSQSAGKDIALMSADDKREFMEKNNYFMEYQPDEKGDMTIVFFDKKFNAPFSIHYISDKEYDIDFIFNNQLITHTFNHNGLTENVPSSKIHLSNQVQGTRKFLSDPSVKGEYLRGSAELENIKNISLPHNPNNNSPEVLMNKLDNIMKIKNSSLKNFNHIIDSNSSTEECDEMFYSRYKESKDDISNLYDKSRLSLLEDIYTSSDVHLKPLPQITIFGENSELVYGSRSVVISENEKKYLESQISDGGTFSPDKKSL